MKDSWKTIAFASCRTASKSGLSKWQYKLLNLLQLLLTQNTTTTLTQSICVSAMPCPWPLRSAFLSADRNMFVFRCNLTNLYQQVFFEVSYSKQSLEHAKPSLKWEIHGYSWKSLKQWWLMILSVRVTHEKWLIFRYFKTLIPFYHSMDKSEEPYATKGTGLTNKNI